MGKLALSRRMKRNRIDCHDMHHRSDHDQRA
jgi:hypothetical protein